MKNIVVHIFGYRDQYFLKDFGVIVRDLMVAKVLGENEHVSDIYFYNRPKSLHEIVLGRKKIEALEVSLPGVKFVNSLSFDILGPLRKRAWLRNIYRTQYKVPPEINDKDFHVVLDFLPIGFLPSWAEVCANFYWYDAIDNFTKHNRYSGRERALVKEKYQHVGEVADLVTGVSGAIKDTFTCDYEVVPNALLVDYSDVESSPCFDFGFIGFVTDKFDVQIVKTLATSGYRVAIYGEIYDRKIELLLSQIDGVYLHGKFNSDAVAQILTTFKVGLIPYLFARMHDESPLKLYQYLSSGLPVMSSYSFGVKSGDVHIYNQFNMLSTAEAALKCYPLGREVAQEYYQNNTWEARLAPVVSRIRRLS